MYSTVSSEGVAMLTKMAPALTPSHDQFSIGAKMNDWMELQSDDAVARQVTREIARELNMGGTIYIMDNENKKYTASQVLSSQLRTTVLRGQPVERMAATRDNSRWEEGPTGTAKYFFNSCLYPAVYRHETPQGTKVFPLTYRVCYSSFLPTYSKDGSKGLLPHRPEFRTVLLRPDVQNPHIQVSVNVDYSLIGDIHCFLSIKASLENSFPVAGSYIYMYPEVSDDNFQNATTPFTVPYNHTVKGASLGMAVFGAVAGWSCMHYTGYIRYIAPNTVMQRDAQYRMESNGSAYNAKSMVIGGNGAPSVTVYSNPLVKIAKQLNFVDMVNDIPLKIAYCNANGFPFIFPASSNFDRPIAEALNSTTVNNFMRQFSPILPNIYTMSMSEDGQPAFLMAGSRRIPFTIYMGSTVTEFAVLQALATYTYNFDNTAPENFMRSGNTQGMADFNNQWASIMEARHKVNVARSKARDERLAPIRTQLADAQTPEQIDAAERALKLEREKLKQEAAAAKARKEKQRKAESEAKKEKRDTTRKQVKDAITAYKKAYEAAAKAKPKSMTKAARAAWNKKWPTYASVKRRINQEMMKEIAGNVHDIFKNPYGNTPGMIHNRRKKVVQILQQKGIEDPAIASITNTLFQGPIARGTIPAFQENSTDFPIEHQLINMDPTVQEEGELHPATTEAGLKEFRDRKARIKAALDAAAKRQAGSEEKGLMVLTPEMIAADQRRARARTEDESATERQAARAAQADADAMNDQRNRTVQSPRGPTLASRIAMRQTTGPEELVGDDAGFGGTQRGSMVQQMGSDGAATAGPQFTPEELDQEDDVPQQGNITGAGRFRGATAGAKYRGATAGANYRGATAGANYRGASASGTMQPLQQAAVRRRVIIRQQAQPDEVSDFDY